MRYAILLGLLVLAPFALPAQAQTASQVMAQDGQIHTQIQGIAIPAIPNAPFSAKVIVQWDEPLANGATISRQYYTLVARDSQGRVRRETRAFVPAGSIAEPLLRTFYVNDPVSAMHINCILSTKKCGVTDFHPRAALTQASATFVAAAGVTREDLGQKTINSIPVTGTRETFSTASDSQGNSVVGSTEFWYASSLQINLSVIRTDPQSGQQTFTVTDLVRTEPDPKWFTVPAGYQIIDARTKSPTPTGN